MPCARRSPDRCRTEDGFGSHARATGVRVAAPSVLEVDVARVREAVDEIKGPWARQSRTCSRRRSARFEVTLTMVLRFATPSLSAESPVTILNVEPGG